MLLALFEVREWGSGVAPVPHATQLFELRAVGLFISTPSGALVASCHLPIILVVARRYEHRKDAIFVVGYGLLASGGALSSLGFVVWCQLLQ